MTRRPTTDPPSRPAGAASPASGLQRDPAGRPEFGTRWRNAETDPPEPWVPVWGYVPEWDHGGEHDWIAQPVREVICLARGEWRLAEDLNCYLPAVKWWQPINRPDPPEDE